MMGNKRDLSSRINLKLGLVCLLALGVVYGCQNKEKQKPTKEKTQTVTPKSKTGKQKKARQAIQSSPTKKQIAANWHTFFSPKTKTSKRLKLVQHGQKFKKAIQHFSDSPMSKAVSVTIKSIKLNGKKSATVNYTINLNDKPVLPNQVGKVIRVDNVWKVSDAAFCKLLAMSGKIPKACPQSEQGKS